MHALSYKILLCVAAAIVFAAAVDARGNHVAEEFKRKVIYRSPQKPGWTSWVGAWFMPDDSMMVSCVQATGPVGDAPRGRSYAGLDVNVIYLRSTDAGKTWKKTAATNVRFETPKH